MKSPLQRSALIVLAVAILAGTAAAAPEPDAKAQQFDTLLKKVLTDPSGSTEADARQMLSLAAELGQTYKASMAIKGYLSQHFRTSPELMLLAARNADATGDFRLAAARYKAYLRAANGDKQTGDVAGRLYTVLIELLESPDDAYQFMAQHHLKLRSAPAARKFDRWMLDQARRRDDHATAAKALADMLADKQPESLKHWYYGDFVDWLFSDLTKAQASQQAALADARKVARQLTGSKKRTAQAEFYLANLAFHASAKGKDDKTLAADFARVNSEAKSYFDTDPTAQTYLDIVAVFTGGHGRFDTDTAEQLKSAKGEVLLHAFDKLSDADRLSVVTHADRYREYPYYMASNAQWARLGSRHEKFFREHDEVARLPLLTRSDNRKDFQAQAKFLAGKPSRTAAVINSVAAGESFPEMAEHLRTRELWHLDYADAYDLLRNHIWPAYKQLNTKDGKEPGDKVFDMVFVAWADKVLAQTPAAQFDEDAMKAYVRAAWRTDESDDKSAFHKRLQSVAWTGFRSDRTRKEIYQDVFNQFKRWTNRFGKPDRNHRDRKPATPQQLKMISAIDEALKAGLRRSDCDASEAPNGFVKAFCQAVQAREDKNPKKFAEAGRELYKDVREWDAKKTDFGSATISWLMEEHSGADPIDLQCETLTDQLERYDPNGENLALRQAMYQAVHNRRNWRLWDITERDQADAKKINDVFAAALRKQIKAKRFWPHLWSYFLGTRRGNRWSDLDRNDDVMGLVIANELLQKHQPSTAERNVAVSYMYLIRREFPNLAKKYPHDSHFDDLYVAEARKTDYLDPEYWEYGVDKDGKVANLAADMLRQYGSPPLGYDDADKVRYTKRQYIDWIGRAMKADADKRSKLLAMLDKGWGSDHMHIYAAGWQYFRDASADKKEDRKVFFVQLGRYLDRVAQLPERYGPPYMKAIEAIENGKEFTADELDVLVRCLTEARPGWWSGNMYYDQLAARTVEGLMAQDRHVELYALTSTLWRLAAETNQAWLMERLAGYANQLQNTDRFDLALVMSAVGIEVASGELPREAKGTLMAVSSRALSDIGGVIPVARSDPRYNIFAAQAAYFAGKLETAWQQYLNNRAKLLESFKDLDPRFVIWLMDRNTATGQYETAQRIALEMTRWFDSVTGGFDPEIRARLLMAEADISFAQEQYPLARSKYLAVASAKEFDGTQAQIDAQLKVANADRVQGRYEEALTLLKRLTQRQDRSIRAEAHYHMAWVKYDQKEFTDAQEEIQKVFTLVPDHPSARILEGQINLGLKKLEEPTEILIGSVTNQRHIVPGMALKVTLEDRNLSVVGSETSIEITAWTDSGDEETFTLMPLGVSKTKFRGVLPTELAAARKNDNMLQVLGYDQVHFDLSERFKKANKITDSRKQSLRVVTNSKLYASSGRILSDEEREALELEAQLARQMGVQSEDKTDVALATIRSATQIKPGNPINVRVVDPDRGQTAEKDTLTVRVTANSGDVIDQLELTETEPYSGVFEGACQTASGQAVAYASDSADGREANFALSAKTEYPAWMALADNVRPKLFTIDLNDNIAMGTMEIVADQTGRRLKSFLVQTSMNGQDFTTVGSWPEAFKPWDGKAHATLVKLPSMPRRFDQKWAIEYLTMGHLRDKQKKVTVPIKNIVTPLGGDVLGKERTLGINWDTPYLAHYKVAFYQPRRQLRTFRLEPKDGENAPGYILCLDGKPAQRNKEGEIEIKQSIGRGVHVLDLYIVTTRKQGAKFQVVTDIEAEPYIGPCPDSMFDATANPQISKGVARKAAEISADNKQQTFTVKFPAETQGRMIRLILTDFELDAPAISKIRLTDAAGEKILPTEYDFLSLRKNDVLEIVPGDQVTISYKDPRILAGGREIHEQFLTATYSNATVSAAFVRYEVKGAQRTTRYVPMRRFKEGDTVVVFIRDPDGDVSEKLDTLKFTARTSEGQPVEFQAIETEPHSGVFVRKLFPVTGEPKRDTEIKVRTGDDIVIHYMDRENTDPGIPWPRQVIVEQVWYAPPQVRAYKVTTSPLPADEAQQARQQEGQDPLAVMAEYVPARRNMLVERPSDPDAVAVTPAIIDGPIALEVLFPAAAQAADSELELFAQTSSARKAAGKTDDDPFDPQVPGTIRIRTRPGDLGRPTAPAGYATVAVKTDPYRMTALDDGRFTFNVPIQLGDTPEQTLIDAEPVAPAGRDEKIALNVRGDDDVIVGFRYKDDEGQTHWVTRRFDLSADAFFDVMDRRYQEPVTGLYVGQTLYFRVIDKSRDTSAEKDAIELTLSTRTGKPQNVTLTETYLHSGVFKGLVRLAYADDAEGMAEPGTVGVYYGDSLVARYERPDSDVKLTRSIGVHKGSDGAIMSFTKRFKDPEIAVKTQFHVAEAFFELAKRHREAGQTELAQSEIAEGKKILTEAIRDYPDTKARAQAEYLLANLALEYATEATDPNEARKHYLEAVRRFSEIVANYADSSYAPKSQYKKAFVYEKMGQIDQACEEYVKLSYRYPDNELVAETIGRLGLYFLNKGKEIREEAASVEDKIEQAKILLKAKEMYVTAGEVFGRLAERFPSHKLAYKTKVSSAQCFMEAGEYDRAVATFNEVIESTEADNDTRAEAMYWCGDCYMRMEDLVNAYKMFKKCEWDYSTSKWAKFARFRLADEKLAKIKGV